MAGYYAHSLFFAHLVLEKFCKALWMKRKNSKEYPYTHNLIKLIKETSIVLKDEQVQFYSDMNLFQTKGRYPDTLHAIEKTVTLDIYKAYSDRLKTEIEWLIKQLQ
jgi:HEPN domain-containing protein